MSWPLLAIEEDHMNDNLWSLATALIGLVGGVLVAVLTQILSKRRMSDKDIFWKWRVAFDRRAFKGPYNWHSAPEPFEKAVKETIKAVNTGVVVTGSGGGGLGKAFIRNREWRAKMDEVERRLSKISQLATGVETPKNGTPTEAIDHERNEIIRTLNEIWQSLGIPELPIPTEVEDIFQD
jgi:hypothetical protein